jgi:hypothetical protein
LLERYPKLNWVCAETTLGWLNYVLDSCDHTWERNQLWKHGVSCEFLLDDWPTTVQRFREFDQEL